MTDEYLAEIRTVDAEYDLFLTLPRIRQIAENLHPVILAAYGTLGTPTVDTMVEDMARCLTALRNLKQDDTQVYRVGMGSRLLCLYDSRNGDYMFTVYGEKLDSMHLDMQIAMSKRPERKCVTHPADKPQPDMYSEACFNSKNMCIDCCVAAGDPCGHEA